MLYQNWRFFSIQFNKSNFENPHTSCGFSYFLAFEPCWTHVLDENRLNVSSDCQHELRSNREENRKSIKIDRWHYYHCGLMHTHTHVCAVNSVDDIIVCNDDLNRDHPDWIYDRVRIYFTFYRQRA